MLHPRVLGRAEGLPGPSWLALLVLDGEAELRGGDARERLAAPALAWRPWGRDRSARFPAGAAAAHVLVGTNALSNAVGYGPEAHDLRDLALRPATAPLAWGSAGLATLRTCFEAVHREATETRPASATLVEAYLRIVLIELWRLRQGQDPGQRHTSPAQRVFDSFVALVDAHFRERWPVARYAEALGVSRDRLGDICQRLHGRPPKTVIDRRTEREARLLLQNSTNSVEQIAGLLGFHSAPQFSRFMRRMAGAPPGRLRRAAGVPSGSAGGSGAQGLHDWP